MLHVTLHLLLNRWTKQLQTLQMLWLDKKRVFAMVYHRLKSSLFLFSYKMLVIRAGLHKMLVRIANSEEPDETASSEDLGLHCLPKAVWQN